MNLPLPARDSLAALVACILAGSLVPAAGALRAATADAGADSTALEEIVVTANKRQEDIRDVPVSVGIVDAKAIEGLQVQNIEDITRIVPGISFAAHNNGPNGPGQDNITIRGISSTVGNPTVGIYIDEVPIITLTGYEGDAEPRLIDIDRVEVLRGPQGTLYGASSEGGTVRFLTVQPDSHAFSGRVKQDISYTDHGGLNADTQGVVNIPVVEGVFAVRVSAEIGGDSGYIDRYALTGSLAAGTQGAGALEKSGTNSDLNAVIHVKALWTPSDTVSVTPDFLYQQQKAADTSTFIPSVGQFGTYSQVPAFIHDTLFIPSLTVKAGLGFADLTSVTSYLNRFVNRQTDGTFFNTAAISQFYLDTAGVAPYTTNQAGNDNILGNINSPVLFRDRFNTWTQEFRLSSPAEQTRVKWVAGVFLSDQEYSHQDYETAPGYSAAFQNIYGYNINSDPVLNPSILNPPYQSNFWGNDLVWTVFDHNNTTQYAAFGQIDFNVTDQLHVGIGDRYVKARESFTESGGGFFDFGGGGTGTCTIVAPATSCVPTPPSGPYTQSADFSTSTPKVTVTYDVTTLASVYGSAGKGFRLGGATTPNTNASCIAGLKTLGYNNVPTNYGPDNLWSYELGTKLLAFEKTLSINADVYLIDWKSIQQSITIPICGGQFNTNVGDARAIGGELEARLKPPAIPGLVLGLNLGGEHAYITSSVNSTAFAVGDHVLYTPEYTATALVDYGWHLSDTVNAFVRGDYEYTGKSYGAFSPQASAPFYTDPSYSTVNARAGITVGSVEVSLFAKNLSNDRTILQSPQINGVTEGYTLRPRTIGLSAQAKF
jgi:outer membrane receptor protein involved in Fe transport